MNPIVTPDQALMLGLVMTRIIGIFLSFPFFNTSMVPMNVRVLFVTAMAFFIVAMFDMSAPKMEWSVVLYVLYILKELLIGFSLGLLVNIFIGAFAYAAEIISYFMGLSIVNVFDPTFGQVSSLSRFFVLMFYLIFFVTQSYHYVIGGIFMSFKYFPVGTFDFNMGIFQFIMEKSALLFMLGFQIAFPFALILFLLNIALALVNRLIPQVNVFIVGLPMQIFVGLAALSLGAAALVYTMVTLLGSLGNDFGGIIRMMGM
jgi:flagellar biosynthetic protein FliR